jgi:transcriptional regulator with XRE-family HTH domain
MNNTFTYTDNEQLKKEIKKTIIDNGYTAKQIADKLGITPQTYQHLINKKQLSFADVNKIMQVMNCSLNITISKNDI